MILSIITINYNNEIGLKKTFESIFSQTYRDFEYIVIDGASSDRSIEIIKEYDQFINYWVSEPDRGIYNAMNKGIAKAHGDYCIFMNSGDVFYDNNVVMQSLLHLDGTVVISGSTILIDGIKRAPSDITFINLVRNTLTHQSTFIKTSYLKKYKYDEELKIVSDWKFLIQVLIMENQSYKSIDTIISRYDLTGISTVNVSLMERERKMVLESLIPFRILKDYESEIDGSDSSLYWQIRQSRFRGLFYTLIVCILKFISIFKKSPTWIKKYPLRIKY